MKPIPATELPTAAKAYLLYGLPKTGKTKFGSSAPRPIALLDFENGALTIQGEKDIDIFPFYSIPKARRWPELITAFDAICRDGKYKTILIDNLEGMGLACMEHTAKVKSKPTQPEWGVYRHMLFNFIEKARDENNLTLIITAHIKFDKNDNGSIIRGTPNVGSKLSETVGGMFDEFYLCSSRREGTSIGYYVSTAGDAYCAAGSRTSAAITLKWTDQPGFKVMQEYRAKSCK